MYVNAKMIHGETVPGMGEEWRRGKRRMVEGVNSTVIYLIHCKNSCKCHNVAPPRTTIKKGQRSHFPHTPPHPLPPTKRKSI
jgi:hypothetical protein